MVLGRENNLDAIRLALALLVIFSHAFVFVIGHHPSDPLAGLTRGTMDFGSLAVGCFFSISGYLVAMSYERDRRPVAFLARRAARVLPGYAAALGISVLVVSPIASRPMGAALSGEELRRAAVAGLTLGPWVSTIAFGGNPMPGVVNGSLWTIHYEFGSYLLLAAIGAAGLLGRGIAAVVLAWVATLALACRWTMATELGFAMGPATRLVIGDPEWWPKLLSYFLAGALLYRFAGRVPRDGRLMVAAALAIPAGLLNPPLGAVVLPAAVTYAIFWLATANAPRAARFKGLVGGDYSYGTYLYGAPVQQLVMMAALGTPLARSPLALFAVTAPLSIVAGAASWHLLERHFLPRRRSAHA